MNVLLIGGPGSLINKLIVKLKKEKHRVYLITGDRYKYTFYEKVFQRYNFPYDSEALYEIFMSVKPDLTIYTGAFDTNFKWDEVQKESVHYSASMVNILMSYATVGKGRLLYLSSADVHEGNYDRLITEETMSKAKSFYASTLLQVEDMCRTYRESRGLDVITLRLDNLFRVPQNRVDIDNVCAEMCMEALESGTVHYNGGHNFTWIYETDAVEYIYRMAVAENCDKPLYQISSSQVITEKKIAEMIRDEFKAAQDDSSENEKTEIRLIEKERAEQNRVMSNELYANEVGLNFFCVEDEILKKIIGHMLEHKDIFLHGEEEKGSLLSRVFKKAGWFIRAIIPYVENLICLIPFYFLYNTASNSQFFSRLDFYLLYVLLFAVVYGQRQATFSAVLAMIGYMFKEMSLRSGMEVLMDYNTYVWTVQLFIVGLVVGYLKDQYKVLQSEGKEERLYLSDKVSDIQEINDSNVRVKDSLENQIVNQNDSIGKIYNIMNSLDQYTPEAVFFYAAEILTKMVNTQDVAIYIMENGGYGRLCTATSSLARSMGNSVKINGEDEFYATLMSGKVYINKTLDEKYPLMAAAAMNGDHMETLIMVWGLSLEAMTLSTANMLSITSGLVQGAITRAARYIQILESQRYDADTGVMEHEEFDKLLQIYKEAQDKKLTEYMLLQINTTVKEKARIGYELRKRLRKNDHVGYKEDGSVEVLLSNMNENDIPIVMERLKVIGVDCKVAEALSI